MGLLLMIWMIHAVVAAVLSFPIVLFGRNRVHWYSWELLALILPFCVWLALEQFWPSSSSAKGWGNLIEPVYFGLAVPGAALVRVIGGKGRQEDERMLAAIL